jgi:hypothetical protein
LLRASAGRPAIDHASATTEKSNSFDARKGIADFDIVKAG